MKRVIVIIFSIFMIIGSVCFVGCSDESTKNGKGSSDKQSNTIKYEITNSNISVYEDSIGTKHIFGLVEIINTGDCDLYLSSGQFDYEDETGRLVESSKIVSVFPTVIKPNEKAYYQDTTISDKVDINGQLKIVPSIKAKKSTVEYIRFNTSETTISTDMFNSLEVTGRVENNSLKNQSFIYVVVFLKDSSEKVIGVLFDIITSEIEPMQKIGFSASSFGLPNTISQKEVKNYTVVSYPNQFQF